MSKRLSDNEPEAAERIIELHEGGGLGYRVIAKILQSEGYIGANKDAVNKLFLKYKNPQNEPDVPKEKSLEYTRMVEARELQRLNLLKEKIAIKARLTELYIEKATIDFKARWSLYHDQNKLLRFASKVLPKTCPGVWSAFLSCCKAYNLDQAKEIAESMGDPSSYEEDVANQINKPFNFYLADKITEHLSMIRAQIEAEASEQSNQAGNYTINEDRSETISIDFSEDSWG
jgi:hypothetical protein